MARYPVKLTAKTKINNRLKGAFLQLGLVTSRQMGEFAGDVKQMASAMMRSEFEGGTGKLASSLKSYSETSKITGVVETTAKNRQGHGYGAAQEYGWRPKGRRRKRKGRFIILRATFGMISRWKRGDKWKP